MTVREIDSLINLIILDMVDFDVILGMDWLSHYHSILDYFYKTITLAMPGIPPIALLGTVNHGQHELFLIFMLGGLS